MAPRPGTPRTIPVPVPSVGTIPTPELAFFKFVRHTGKAKILVNVVTSLTPETNRILWNTPTVYGNSNASYLWLLLSGPYQWGDNMIEE